MRKFLIAAIVIIIVAYGFYSIVPWAECLNYLSAMEENLIKYLTR